MEHRFGIAWQLGVEHQAEVGQIDAAGRDVGGDADPRAAVAQRLQRARPLGLRQLPRERDGGEAAFAEIRMQPVHARARRAEHHGDPWLFEAEDVHHRALDLVRRDQARAILDVAVLAGGGAGRDAQRVALVALGQLLDAARHRGTEQQRAARGGGGVEDRLQLLAEAEVEHLVGLVEHHGLEGGGVEVVALNVVAHAPRRADDDVRAALEEAPLRPGVHAADRRPDAPTRGFVEPGQLVLDLERELARGCDDQGERRARRRHPLRVAQQVGGQRQAVGDGLAGAGLGGDEQVAPRLLLQHGLLDGGWLGVAALGKRLGERGGKRGKGHGCPLFPPSPACRQAPRLDAPPPGS